MKAFLRDGQSFIAVSPTPKEDIENGLVITLEGTSMTTDIKAGVMRYDIPEEYRGKITSVAVNDPSSAR